MREINVNAIKEAVSEMCIEINHVLSKDMKKVLSNACQNEESELGKQILSQLEENLKIAESEMIPICQDTGMAVILWRLVRTSI